jgi:hypothetical protein
MDDAPEDYAFLMSAVEDNFSDAFSSRANRTITPTNADTGNPLLPRHLDSSFSGFIECTSLGANRMNFPVKSDNGVTNYAGWLMMHRALYELSPLRAGVVGT